MILVDTGAFYALADRKDVNHRVAVECLNRLDEPLATHNLVLTEAWYLLESRLGRGAARRLMDQITQGRVELLSVDAKDITAAMVIEERYSDLALGLTDAVSLSLCNRERITRCSPSIARISAVFSPSTRRRCGFYRTEPRAYVTSSSRTLQVGLQVRLPVMPSSQSSPSLS